MLAQSLRAIAWGGRLLVVGFAGGAIPELAANRILLKSCAVLGVRAGEAARKAAVIWPRRRWRRSRAMPKAALCARTSRRACRSARYAEGMRLLMERKAIGRVVLLPGAAA